MHTRKIISTIQEETLGIHPRLQLLQYLCKILPPYSGSRLRSLALRAAGFEIGHGCVIWGMPLITGGDNIYKNLYIGHNSMINLGCLFDLGAQITIGNYVALGHQVAILTTSHFQGPHNFRAGRVYTQPVTIKDGAWIGTRVTILPGVTIGEGAIVAAGSVVNKDVAANTLAAGVPARFVKNIITE